MTRRLAAILILSCGAACVAHEPATESATAAVGQRATASVSGLLITVPQQGRQLNLDIHYPVRGERLPLVVFFHGALCSPAGYAGLADHWASQGYVVIMPAHPDFGSQGRPDADRALRVFFDQIAEMSMIVDTLDEIVAKVEPLRGRIDSTRIAAAGYSMGALISSALVGLERTGLNGERRNFKDERFDVAVLLSGPGPLPNTPEGAWDSMTLPTLATTGTRDHANRGGEGATWEWRLGAYNLTPPGNKFALIVDEADHFLGGMLCAERGSGEPDHEAFNIVADVSTDFLDAYLKNDAAARESLSNDVVAAATAGRAELRSK